MFGVETAILGFCFITLQWLRFGFSGYSAWKIATKVFWLLLQSANLEITSKMICTCTSCFTFISGTISWDVASREMDDCLFLKPVKPDGETAKTINCMDEFKL